MNTFISELVGAAGQVVLFALIPFIWWLITARKKENFFKWIGLKKVKSNGGLLKAVIIAVIAKASGSIVPSWMLHGITNVIVTCMAL